MTYVSEADGLERHLVELERMRGLGADRILPEPREPRDGSSAAATASR